MALKETATTRRGFTMLRAFLLVVAILLVEPASAETRRWTDSTGQRHVEAELFTSQAQTVWLRRSDGEVYGVPLAELSQTDRQYVETLARQKNNQTGVSGCQAAGHVRYRAARVLGQFANPKIDESSGLAASRRHPGLFWTHNDSGDDARIYLFDKQGCDRGSCLLEGVRAFDWEDMAAFQADGKNYLLLADTGNSSLAAAVHMLYLVEEPALDTAGKVAVESLLVVQTIHFSYADDFRNSEAVAVDPTDKTILLVSKEKDVGCSVYALAWPPNDPGKDFVARRIARLKIPLVTALDISPDGRRAVVLFYGNAYEFTRAEGEDWGTAFSREPCEIEMPDRVQGEAICFGLDGKTLYLTSEQLPAPFWEVPAEE